MEKHLTLLFKRYPELTVCREGLIDAFEIIKGSLKNGGVLFVCGNGGSAADSEHIVGELMKGFKMKRELSCELKEKFGARFGERGIKLAGSLQGGLRAVSLTSHYSLSSAVSNDNGDSLTFAQQLFALAKPGDVIIGISTSGNAQNVCNALMTADIMGLKKIALTGKSGGESAKLCDVLLNVPEQETYMVQEYHLPLYHALCLMLEDYFYGATC